MIWRVLPWHVPLDEAARLISRRYKMRRLSLLPDDTPVWFANAILDESVIQCVSTVSGKRQAFVIGPRHRLWSPDAGKTLIDRVGDRYQRFVEPAVSRPWLWWFILVHDALLQEAAPRRVGAGWGSLLLRRAVMPLRNLLAARRALRHIATAADWHDVDKPAFWTDAAPLFGDPEKLLFGPAAPFSPKEPFDIVSHKIAVPPGLSYEWKSEDRLHLLSKTWRPVPPSRHRDLPRAGKRIAYRGMVLMQRPKPIANRAVKENLDRALGRLHDNNVIPPKDRK